MIDFAKLWMRVVAECAPRDHYSPHEPPDHWSRVERNGLILATKTGANVDVVRLFGLFHDSQRVNDGWDPDHGKRGAFYAGQLRGEDFELSDADFALLEYACIWHTEGGQHDDPTIGTCWDAYRLDLGRVGMIPNAKFMSTAFGTEIANHGLIYPWVHLADPWLACRWDRWPAYRGTA